MKGVKLPHFRRFFPWSGQIQYLHPILKNHRLKFTEFGFDPRLMEGIDASGYEDATPVQEQVIPLVMQGKDVIASAQTGTGKTAAFLLPLIHKIISTPHEDHTNNALVVVPTRELAIQIAQNLEGLSYFTSVSSIAVYGGGDGNAFVQEKKALSQGADLVICTPGKMMSHIKMGYVKLSGLKYLQATQQHLLSQIIKNNLSVRQTEELVRRLLDEQPAAKKAQTGHRVSADSRALEDRMRRVLGTKVSLFRSKKGGTLVIHFYSEEELDTIYRRIVKGD